MRSQQITSFSASDLQLHLISTSNNARITTCRFHSPVFLNCEIYSVKYFGILYLHSQKLAKKLYDLLWSINYLSLIQSKQTHLKLALTVSILLKEMALLSQAVERPQYSKKCCYHTARECKIHYTPMLTGPMLISRSMRLYCFQLSIIKFYY